MGGDARDRPAGRRHRGHGRRPAATARRRRALLARPLVWLGCRFFAADWTREPWKLAERDLEQVETRLQLRLRASRGGPDPWRRHCTSSTTARGKFEYGGTSMNERGIHLRETAERLASSLSRNASRRSIARVATTISAAKTGRESAPVWAVRAKQDDFATRNGNSPPSRRGGLAPPTKRGFAPTELGSSRVCVGSASRWFPRWWLRGGRPPRSAGGASRLALAAPSSPTARSPLALACRYCGEAGRPLTPQSPSLPRSG